MSSEVYKSQTINAFATLVWFCKIFIGRKRGGLEPWPPTGPMPPVRETGDNPVKGTAPPRIHQVVVPNLPDTPAVVASR
jgi:hypothetical protein